MENLEYKRARKAHEFIIAVDQGQTEDTKKKYRSIVQSAGPLIHQAGLFQTLAFYFQKGKPHHQLIAEHFLGWLFNNYTTDAQTLYFNNLLTMGDMEARRMTAEVQAFLLWLKRFAAAKLPEADTDED